jgi:hypothetical protein
MRLDGRLAVGMQASGPLRVWIPALAHGPTAQRQWQFQNKSFFND